MGTLWFKKIIYIFEGGGGGRKWTLFKTNLTLKHIYYLPKSVPPQKKKKFYHREAMPAEKEFFEGVLSSSTSL